MKTPRIGPDEESRRRENWQRLKAEMPDASRFVRDLYDLGMVEGARCVNYIGPIGEGPKYPPEKCVPLTEISTESWASFVAKAEKEKSRGPG